MTRLIPSVFALLFGLPTLFIINYLAPTFLDENSGVIGIAVGVVGIILGFIIESKVTP